MTEQLWDVDGPTYDVAFGNTGFQIYIAGEILPVGVPMIAAAAGQTVTMSCADCTTSTTAYLATFCDTSLLDASIQANGATNTAPRPIVSIGGNVWSISVDASQLRRGYRYSVCLDLDGATTVSPNADSDIRVYISAVTSAGDGIMRPGAAEVLRLPCTVGCSAASSAYLSTTKVPYEVPVLVGGEQVGINLVYLPLACDSTVNFGTTALTYVRTEASTFVADGAGAWKITKIGRASCRERV